MTDCSNAEVFFKEFDRMCRSITRRSVFLEMFPNEVVTEDVVIFCPHEVDSTVRCDIQTHRSAEVE